MKVKFIIFVVLIALSQPLFCLAVERLPEKKDDLVFKIFQMTESLNEMIELLKSQQSKTADLQKLQIAVSYLSFRSRSIEMKEYDLNQKKQIRDRIEETITKIKADPEEWEKFEKRFQSEKTGQSSDDPRPAERRIKLLQERIETLDSDIIVAEIEIQGLKDELSKYETYVRKQLVLYN